MTVGAASHPLSQQLAVRLARRQAELQEQLQAAAIAGLAAEPDLQDFKDLAAEDTRALLDQAAQAQAADELAQVVAALHRMREGRYGHCADCGDPIAAPRLLALPATAFCTACQAVHEHPVIARR